MPNMSNDKIRDVDPALSSHFCAGKSLAYARRRLPFSSSRRPVRSTPGMALGVASLAPLHHRRMQASACAVERRGLFFRLFPLAHLIAAARARESIDLNPSILPPPFPTIPIDSKLMTWRLEGDCIFFLPFSTPLFPGAELDFGQRKLGLPFSLPSPCPQSDFSSRRV